MNRVARFRSQANARLRSRAPSQPQADAWGYRGYGASPVRKRGAITGTNSSPFVIGFLSHHTRQAARGNLASDTPLGFGLPQRPQRHPEPRHQNRAYSREGPRRQVHGGTLIPGDGADQSGNPQPP